MGNLCGKGGVADTPAKGAKAKAPAPKDPKELAMEEKLSKLLKDKRDQFLESKDLVPFTKILMKMGKMAQVLKHLHSIFKDIDLDGNGTLDLDELKALMKKIGCDLPDAGLELMFECADLEHENKLTEREFVVSLAVAYLMRAVPSFNKQKSDGILMPPQETEPPAPGSAAAVNEQSKDRAKRSSVAHIAISGQAAAGGAQSEAVFLGYGDEVHYLMHWIVAAYLLFDPETKGCIEKNTVGDMMDEKGHGSGASAFLSDQRWQELDFDSNGSISFAEFCFAFTGWILDSAGEDDDE